MKRIEKMILGEREASTSERTSPKASRGANTAPIKKIGRTIVERTRTQLFWSPNRQQESGLALCTCSVSLPPLHRVWEEKTSMV